MTRPVTTTREVAKLIEELEKHPEALGYLKKFENSHPVAGPWKNPLWYRSQLEETLLHHAGNGDAECLDMLLYSGIRLNVFERYHELMSENRLNACVEDVFAGRRKSSRTGVVFNKCLTQLIDNGNQELFEEKLVSLMSMGGRKLLASPVNAASLRPEDFHFARDVGASPEKLARFRFGVVRLLDSGMVNILGHLTRSLDLTLLTGAEKFREDVPKEKEQRYLYWQEYLKALVLGHNPTGHATLCELGVGASGAVFMTLRELVAADDIEGVERLSRVFDLPHIYKVLDDDRPLKKDLAKTFHLDGNEPLFTPASLLNLSLPKGRGGISTGKSAQSKSFEMFDLLMKTGLAPYLEQPRHKAFFAAGIGNEMENDPELFDTVCSTSGIDGLVAGLSEADLINRTAEYGYVCASFYFKRLRESQDPEKTKGEMLSKLNEKAQGRIFGAPGFMARLKLTNSDRKYCSSDAVRSQMMAIDLGL